MLPCVDVANGTLVEAVALIDCAVDGGDSVDEALNTRGADRLMQDSYSEKCELVHRSFLDSAKFSMAGFCFEVGVRGGLFGFGGVEAEADVVGGPVAVGVAEGGFEQSDGVGDCCRAVGWVELVEDAVAEGVEPGLHTVGEWGGAGDQVDGLDCEACAFEKTAIDGGRWVEAGRGGFGVDVEGCEGGLKCGADGGDVAVTAHLGDETAAGAEGSVDAGECGLLAGDSGDPVEGCVGEDGVELVFVGEVGRVVLLDIEIARAGGGEHGRRGVDAEDVGSGSGELFGEGSVAAAEIEDLFAGLGVQEFNDSGGEVGDEAAVGGVGIGVPGLACSCWRGHGGIVSLAEGDARGR
jgi:hypothetical protein